MVRNNKDSQTKILYVFMLLPACVVFAGCSAMTNPVANGIPVRILPEELLAKSKEPLETIPLDWLRQPQPETYRLAADDILGIYIDGILGERGQLPPVTTPESDLPPAIGLPIPVREDGTIPLPYVDPIDVEGLSIVEAEKAIVEAYTVTKRILEPARARILVSLLQPRTTRILVVRQDSGFASGQQLDLFRGPLRRSGPALIQNGSERLGTGQVLDLPAYENDVLTALTRTGGLPGLDAVNEVVIYRGSYRGDENRGLPDRRQNDGAREITRIPLRVLPGLPPPFKPEDIILNKGDIVFIERREAELYYTGGLLPTREVPLPRDYDLDVVEAVIQTGGPVVNGRISSNNLSGQIGDQGIGTPNPSQLSVLRRMPDGRQVVIKVNLNRALEDPRENILVQKGDILILQETTGEAFVRYVTAVTGYSFFGRWLDRGDATGTATIVGP